MSAPRRHRLHSLGQGMARPGRGVRARYRDTGMAIGMQGSMAPAVLRQTDHEGYRPVPSDISVHAASTAFSVRPDPDDWGWPVAEPSTLSWPDPAETAFSFSMESPPAPPSAQIAPPIAPPMASAQPLADHEAEDDVHAILREKGLEPAHPPQPVAAPAPMPSRDEPTADYPAEPAADRHALFDQLSRTMPHATSFQLGRFNFDRHFDMLEEGMSLAPSHLPSAQPAPSAGRDMHELDLLSEIAALSEAAGVPLRREAETDAFMARVARAQGTSLASLAGEEDEEDEPAEEEDGEEEDFAGAEQAFEDEAASPWSEAEEDAAEQETEEEDG